jgi:hypothetical protein
MSTTSWVQVVMYVSVLLKPSTLIPNKFLTSLCYLIRPLSSYAFCWFCQAAFVDDWNWTWDYVHNFSIKQIFASTFLYFLGSPSVPSTLFQFLKTTQYNLHKLHNISE